MDPDTDLTRRIVKGSKTVLVFTLLSSPLGYFLRILYSHTLSIDMYGLFYAVLAMFTVLSTYNDLGFGYSVGYFVPKYFKKGDYETTWKLYIYEQIIEMSSSILLSLILIIFSSWLALNYFKVLEARNLILILCIYFISNSIIEALYRFFIGLQQERYYSSFQITKLGLTLLFSLVVFFLNQASVLTFALAWSTSYLLAALLYLYLLHKKNGFIMRKISYDPKLLKLMAGYALPTLLTTSIYTAISSTDVFFLTIFKGVRFVGIYNVIIPIVSISSLLFSPLNTFLFPLVSHLMEGSKNKVELLVSETFKMVPFLGFYFALFIVMFPKTPISLLFGDKWVSLAYVPLSIIAIGFIASSLSSFLTTFVTGIGKVKERLYASIFIALVNIVICAFLTYFYGLIGVVISNSIIYFLSALIYAKILHQEIKFKYPLFLYVELMAVAAIFLGLVRFLGFYPQGWISYILSGIVYTLIIFVLSLSLKVLDRNLLRSIVRG